jgi:hypothetical protein
MEAPRNRPLISRAMSDVFHSERDAHAACTALLRDAGSRQGVRPLLRRLGFQQPLRRLPTRTDLPGARAAATACNGPFAAFVVELRGAQDADSVRRLGRALRARDRVRHHLLVVADATWQRLAFACSSPAAPLRHVVIDRSDLRPADVEVVEEMLPPPGEGPTATALRIARALDRSRAGARFFRDVVGVRDLLARSWTGVPTAAAADRDALSLLLLSRLMFLYFLQQRGLLAGRGDFLPALLRNWLQQRHATSFYRARLRPVFFEALNRRPERRPPRAAAFGTLPYLNGGLFEKHALEVRHPALDVRDDVLLRVFDSLLEKYRFTSEGAEHRDDEPGVGVDPEMLGRIFEGLMPGERRGRTGTYYTPAPLVEHVVGAALASHVAGRCGIDVPLAARLLDGAVDDAPAAIRTAAGDVLRSVRVLDPACGSGAFLLGALTRIAASVAALGRPEHAGHGGSAGHAGSAGHGGSAGHDGHAATDVRRHVVGESLHGVDLLEDAALICCLRLWLALVPRCADAGAVPPLPNLDRRVRQGDALVDPLDIGDSVAGRAAHTDTTPDLRALARRMEPVSRRYLAAEPHERAVLRRQLQRLEASLARAWFRDLDARLGVEVREYAARSADVDLFGEALPHARSAAAALQAARRRLDELASFRREATGGGRLPFFSFRVHFAEAADGFDIIVSNPPWIRAHRWPPGTRMLLRERYDVCANAGWPYAAKLLRQPSAAGAQVDLALLFLERSIRLLRQHGTLALLLPAKLFRSLYAAGARELLLSATRLGVVEDHALDHRGMFDADAFTGVIVATREQHATREQRATPLSSGDSGAGGEVEVTLGRAGAQPLRFRMAAAELPLRPGDARSPWLLAPPGCAAALRVMQAAGPPLGEQLAIRRGAMTRANDVLLVRDVEVKLGDIARIRADGYYRATAGGDRSRWSAWIEASALRPALRGADIAAWRAQPGRHVVWVPRNDDPGALTPPRLGRYLRRHRTTLRQQPRELGTLHRLSPRMLGHKVVWSDLAADLRAAAVPPSVRCVTGIEAPIVPLNTVYFVATDALDEALLLAAYLNSLPVRVFARTIAERAKDAHFRFFAWTVGVLPLPRDWRTGGHTQRLLAIARAAHADGRIADAARSELDALVARSYGLDEDDVAHLQHFDAWLAGRDATHREAP